ncbi:MAG: hypothetical protein IJG53_06430 [Eggerthellaceae bacterium]|nr:hypothetical protein [Eggerthellaceae bacterium]
MTFPSTLSCGDRFVLGSWGGEPIQWRVLELSENTVLAISEEAIDCKPFNERASEGNLWRTSDLCAWLNDTFLEDAFSSDERTRIQEVACLTSEAAEKCFRGDEDRICRATAHAERQGVYARKATGACSWWLRLPGGDAERAAYVGTDGYIYTLGDDVNSRLIGVRPTLRLSL